MLAGYTVAWCHCWKSFNFGETIKRVKEIYPTKKHSCSLIRYVDKWHYIVDKSRISNTRIIGSQSAMELKSPYETETCVAELCSCFHLIFKLAQMKIRSWTCWTCRNSLHSEGVLTGGVGHDACVTRGVLIRNVYACSSLFDRCNLTACHYLKIES